MVISDICTRHFAYSSSLVAELLLVVVERPWNIRVSLDPFRLKLLEWWKHSL